MHHKSFLKMKNDKIQNMQLYLVIMITWDTVKLKIIMNTFFRLSWTIHHAKFLEFEIFKILLLALLIHILRYRKVVTDGCSSAPSSVQTMKTALPGLSKTQMFLVTLSTPVILCPKFYAPVPSKTMAIPELFTMSKIRKFKNCSSNMESQQSLV